MPMAYQEIARIRNTNYIKSCAYVFALFAAAPGVKSQSHQCIKQAVTRQSCPVTANPGQATTARLRSWRRTLVKVRTLQAQNARCPAVHGRQQKAPATSDTNAADS